MPSREPASKYINILFIFSIAFPLASFAGEKIFISQQEGNQILHVQSESCINIGGIGIKLPQGDHGFSKVQSPNSRGLSIYPGESVQSKLFKLNFIDVGMMDVQRTTKMIASFKSGKRKNAGLIEENLFCETFPNESENGTDMANCFKFGHSFFIKFNIQPLVPENQGNKLVGNLKEYLMDCQNLSSLNLLDKAI